jgi:hypothetical protein
MLKNASDTAKNLSHIRCRYQPVQDRIRVTGDTENESSETFWLTRRMVSQIVPHIAQYIEKQVADKMDKLLADVKAQLAKSQQEKSEIRWRESAEAGPTAQPVSTATSSVQASAPVPWLVVKINLAPTDAGCRLMFLGEGGESVCVTLRAQALCRLLAVWHEQCQQAQWQSLSWPAWVSDLMAAPATPVSAVLH